MDTSKELSLSTDYLKNIVLMNRDEDMFTFLIVFTDQINRTNKKQQEIIINRFSADFISPKVSKIHKTDPTNSEFFIEIRLRKNEMKNIITIKETIDNFFRLSQGENILINKENYWIIKKIAKSIGNLELYKKIKKIFPIFEKEKEIEVTNKLQILEKEKKFNMIIDELQKEDKGILRKKKIEFASMHFYQISNSEILKLDIDLIYEIISNENLIIDDEDSFFEFVKQILMKIEKSKRDIKETEKRCKEKRIEMNKNNNFSKDKPDFFELIEFRGLSENKFVEFFEIFDYTDMTNGMWGKLSQCFHPSQCQDQMQCSSLQKRYKDKTNFGIFEPNSQDLFDGIINHLTKEIGGNVSEKKIVDVTSSSIDDCHPDHVPQVSVDLHDKSNYFQSNKEKNSWLCYDFKKKKVCPTHYSIRSRDDYGKGNFHLQSWVIEGSNDDIDFSGKKWEIIDERHKDLSLSSRSAQNIFEIKKKTNVFYRYLRIRNIDDQIYFLTLSALEYYGTIK